MARTRSRSLGRGDAGAAKSPPSPARKGGKSPGRGRSVEKKGGKSPGRGRSVEKKGGSKSPGRKSRSKSASKGVVGAGPPTRASRSITPKAKGGKPKAPAGTTPTPVTSVVEPRAYKVQSGGTPALRHSTRISQQVVSPVVPVVRESREHVPLTTERDMHLVMVVLHIILMPAFVIWANRVCTKEACSILTRPPLPPLSSFFDVKSSLTFLGFHCVQAVFMLIPAIPGLAKSVHMPGRDRYNCNGFLSCLLTLGLYSTLVHFKHPVTSMPLHSVQRISFSLKLSLLLSIAMYIKARFGPTSFRAPGGNTGNILYDFFMGKEISPRSLRRRFDWKQFVVRMGLITLLMINVSALHREVTRSNFSPNPVICFITACQIFSVLDYFWHEDQGLNSTLFKHDGTGLQVIAMSLVGVPFITSLPTRYAILFHLERQWFQLVGSFFLFATGYFIYRGSSTQMSSSKPGSSAPYRGGRYITGSQGRRILISGWWGIVRRPNYLGLVIMCVATSLPCGFTHFYPWIPPLFTLIHLAVRAKLDDRRCRKRYGPAWDTYRQKTRKLIIPYLF